MSEDRELVFVYGTLRRGGSNHFRMADAEFIESGTLRGRLYRIDWYPGLVLDASGDEISGEIFAVDPQRLTSLDEFEGHEYRRIRATVKTPYGIPMKAWMWEWLMPVDESHRILSGDWSKENGV
jgi:gamma-glutamylcyclotransferase (GGCT)/AIG2-like uncharacterized protein YtfP